MTRPQHAPPGLFAAFQPSPIERLQVPCAARRGQQRLSEADAEGGGPETAKRERRPALKPLKRLERYLSAIFKLGRTEWMAKSSLRTGEQNERRIQELEGQLESLGALHEAVGRLEGRIEEQNNQLAVQKELGQALHAEAARSFSDLSRRIDQLLLHGGALGAAPSVVSKGSQPEITITETEGFRAFRDTFYHRLENRYRGSRSEIKRRLRTYLPDVEAAAIRTGNLPVLDIGCGRGEWLELLAEVGIAASGIDINPAQVETPGTMGLDVKNGEAVDVLSKAAASSLSVISAHHVVEHLPFDTVAWITREALRVLAPGGILLFETPNTRNVLVGATTFHTDPTHIKPMPEQVLGILFETVGFHPVETRGLNPHERLNEFLARPGFDDELAQLLFGAQDLAVLGTRPVGDPA